MQKNLYHCRPYYHRSFLQYIVRDHLHLHSENLFLPVFLCAVSVHHAISFLSPQVLRSISAYKVHMIIAFSLCHYQTYIVDVNFVLFARALIFLRSFTAIGWESFSSWIVFLSDKFKANPTSDDEDVYYMVFLQLIHRCAQRSDFYEHSLFRCKYSFLCGIRIMAFLKQLTNEYSSLAASPKAASISAAIVVLLIMERISSIYHERHTRQFFVDSFFFWNIVTIFVYPLKKWKAVWGFEIGRLLFRVKVLVPTEVSG